ncbi:MAG: hypothetical protein CL455_03630 [Acidimicrobiaceae bacterium]|nr:hypothetical protein [Acidimicrobiaceae bacterium]MEC7845179.1 lysophospholipid acyltransferase family protein [Actinomycetota bacterium]
MKPIKQIRSFRRSGKVMAIFSRIFSRHDFQEDINLPVDSPILFAANHRSFFDVIIAWAVFSESGINCHCFIRADLFEKPVIGSWLKRNGCIPASRSTREEAEKRAITELNSGHAVAIMPEGRLVPPDERPDGVGQGRPGISRIARATGAKIVPVAIEGSEIVWPLGRAFPIPKLKKPLVSVRFGTPFHLTSDDDIENVETIMNSIRDLLTEGKDL